MSAIIHGVSLVIAGGMGQSCHPRDDFSDLISSVIDNNITWRGTYLLGQAVLGNATYPLTFEGVLGRCEMNQSLYASFQLGNSFDLAGTFFVSESDMVSASGCCIARFLS